MACAEVQNPGGSKLAKLPANLRSSFCMKLQTGLVGGVQAVEVAVELGVPARQMCVGMSCACRHADGLARTPDAPANITANLDNARNKIHIML